MAKTKSPAVHDPRWTSKLTPAPGDLRIIQAFLNTRDVAKQTDLKSPQALADWLELWGLVPPATPINASDLKRALEVREALRALVAAHRGLEVNDAAITQLDRAMATATIRVRIGAGGQMRFEPATGGLDGALARLCAIVSTAQLSDTWTRVKICAGEKCRAVFFDSAKNHSRKWCSTQCSSRSTSLLYRHRNLKQIRDQDRGDAMTRRFNRKYGL